MLLENKAAIVTGSECRGLVLDMFRTFVEPLELEFGVKSNHRVGRFSDVHNIREVLGNYAQGNANAAVVKAAEAQVLTKGNVSLALAGGGEGIALGVDIGTLHIDPAK